MSKRLPDFDLEQYLPYRLSVLSGLVSNQLAGHYKSAFGISVPEWRVLLHVGYSDSPSIRDIERRVFLEKSKVSRAATRLEAKGYITKQTDEGDRRLLKLAITEKGADLLEQLIPIATAFQDRLMQVLGEAEPALQEALDLLLEDLK